MATKIRKSNDPEVDRASARTAEEDYFERLAASMAATAGIFDPTSNRTYDASIKNRITKEVDDRSAEVKAQIKRHAERDLMRTYEEMPKNRVVLHEVVHKELLGRPAVKVVVAGAAFSPVEAPIEVVLQSTDAEAVVRVLDRGIGLAGADPAKEARAGSRVSSA